MFSGDVQCVYCGCKINFSGNLISYQNQRCANHNQEHQFPGMKIIVNEINNNTSYLKNLPLTTQRKSSLKPFKQPKVLKPVKPTIAASTHMRSYITKEFTRNSIKQQKMVQTSNLHVPNGHIGKYQLGIELTIF